MEELERENKNLTVSLFLKISRKLQKFSLPPIFIRLFVPRSFPPFFLDRFFEKKKKLEKDTKLRARDKNRKCQFAQENRECFKSTSILCFA